MRRAGALVFLLAGAAAADPAKLTIAGRVVGASDKHTVYVALWDNTSFLDRPVRQLKLAPGSDGSYRFEVAPGRWAVSAFEDRNGNGVLDMGLFGPKEPSGFWRPFHGWHKPRFDEVASQVDHNVSDADVALK
jgi:uncharacterized protein (DUF2141 family)